MKPQRNPRYLAWIQTQPCCVCGSRKAVEASHSVENGAATFQLLSYSIYDSAIAQSSYALGSGGQAFSVTGGNTTISVTAPPGCNWSVSGAPDWVASFGTSSGTGSGTMSYQVAANGGTDRSATIMIGGVAVTLEQKATIPSLFEFDSPAGAQMGGPRIRIPSATHTFTTLPPLAK